MFLIHWLLDTEEKLNFQTKFIGSSLRNWSNFTHQRPKLQKNWLNFANAVKVVNVEPTFFRVALLDGVLIFCVQKEIQYSDVLEKNSEKPKTIKFLISENWCIAHTTQYVLFVIFWVANYKSGYRFAKFMFSHYFLQYPCSFHGFFGH